VIQIPAKGVLWVGVGARAVEPHDATFAWIVDAMKLRGLRGVYRAIERIVNGLGDVNRQHTVQVPCARTTPAPQVAISLHQTIVVPQTHLGRDLLNLSESWIGGVIQPAYGPLTEKIQDLVERVHAGRNVRLILEHATSE